jgi:DNA-binding MarR family transcriptional regulator
MSAHKLGYLLKHAYQRYGELTTSELAPLGIRPGEWAALSCLDEQHGRSQREVAELLGIDRTRMVALVDDLQAKGWVERRPHSGDRRKNTVSLTPTGRELMQAAGKRIDECEQRFLAVLGASDAAQLKDALDALLRQPQGAEISTS